MNATADKDTTSIAASSTSNSEIQCSTETPATRSEEGESDDDDTNHDNDKLHHDTDGEEADPNGDSDEECGRSSVSSSLAASWTTTGTPASTDQGRQSSGDTTVGSAVARNDSISDTTAVVATPNNEESPGAYKQDNEDNQEYGECKQEELEEECKQEEEEYKQEEEEEEVSEEERRDSMLALKIVRERSTMLVGGESDVYYYANDEEDNEYDDDHYDYDDISTHRNHEAYANTSGDCIPDHSHNNSNGKVDDSHIHGIPDTNYPCSSTDHDRSNKAAMSSGSNCRNSSSELEEPIQQQQQQQCQEEQPQYTGVGAFAVAPRPISSVHQNDEDSSFHSNGDRIILPADANQDHDDNTSGRDGGSIIAEDGPALIEATLVVEGELNLLVEAEPMSSQYSLTTIIRYTTELLRQQQQQQTLMTDPESQTPENGAGKGRKKARTTTTSRKKSVAVIMIAIIVVLAVIGLTVGLTAQKQRNEAEEEEVLSHAPFTIELHNTTKEAILVNPASPQAKANKWALQDPNLHTYSLQRQLSRFALATIFYSTGGESSWSRTDNWLDYNRSECAWYSSHELSVCNDEEENVIIMNLSRNGLRGTFPFELRYLEGLKIFDISQNQIEQSNVNVFLPHIEVVDLSHNRLGGKASYELGSIAFKLHTVRLNDNLLSGTLHPGVDIFLPNLRVLDMARNKYFGNIPENQFGRNGPLEVLNYAENNLRGPLPASLTGYAYLKVLNLTGNQQLTGTIPVEYLSWSNLTYLGVANTSLTGTVPSELCHKKMIEIQADCDELQCCQES